MNYGLDIIPLFVTTCALDPSSSSSESKMEDSSSESEEERPNSLGIRSNLPFGQESGFSEEETSTVLPSQSPFTSNGGRRMSTSSSMRSEISSVSSKTAEPNNVEFIGPCAERTYIKSSNNKAVLLTMCIGLDSKDPNYCVVDKDPFYKDRRQKNKFKYTRSQLHDELIRRHRIRHPSQTKDKACRSFNQERCILELLQHPITNQVDVEWLKKTEQEMRASLSNAETERNELSDLHKDGSEPWIGPKAWLRLYHVMVDDRVKPAYLRVHDWADRQSIDARNSDDRPKSFFELAADLYNDDDFAVITNAYPDLHSDFKEPIHIPSHGNDNSIPTASEEKIKKKLAEARSKLMVIIQNWELSGNGSGQQASSDRTFGHITTEQRWRNTDTEEEEEFMDGDNRSSFLQFNKSHLLYMWELFDKNGILYQTMNKLDESVSASSSKQPSTCASAANATSEKRSRQKKDDDEEYRESKRMYHETIAKAMTNLANSCNLTHVADARSELRKLRRELRESTDPEEQLELKQAIAEQEEFAQTAMSKLT